MQRWIIAVGLCLLGVSSALQNDGSDASPNNEQEGSCDADTAVMQSSALTNTGLTARLMKSLVHVDSAIFSLSPTAPWTDSGNQNTNFLGTGVVIPGKRILITGQGAQHATRILVKQFESSQRFSATVELLDPEMDVAVVKVEDDDFWEEVEPVELGDDPEMGDKLISIGVKTGGVSVVESPVAHFSYGPRSACDWMRHAYESDDSPWAHYLTINLARSPKIRDGGFVVQSDTGKMCGFVSGSILSMRPLKRMLRNLDAYGKLVRHADIPVATQSMENPTMKKHFGLTKAALKEADLSAYKPSGFRLREVYTTFVPADPTKPADELKILPTNGLEVGDVIVAVDGVDVGDDSRVILNGATRVHYSVLFADKIPGDTVMVTVLRNKKFHQLSVPLGARKFIVDAFTFATRQPRFFFYGGFPFIPGTWDVMSAEPYRLHDADYHLFRWPVRCETGDEEYVFVTQIVSSEISVGYPVSSTMSKIETVNDVKVKNLKHLVELIEGPGIVKGEGSDKSEFVKIVTDLSDVIIIEKSEADRITPKLMDRENISKDRNL